MSNLEHALIPVNVHFKIPWRPDLWLARVCEVFDDVSHGMTKYIKVKCCNIRSELEDNLMRPHGDCTERCPDEHAETQRKLLMECTQFAFMGRMNVDLRQRSSVCSEEDFEEKKEAAILGFSVVVFIGEILLSFVQDLGIRGHVHPGTYLSLEGTVAKARELETQMAGLVRDCPMPEPKYVYFKPEDFFVKNLQLLSGRCDNFTRQYKSKLLAAFVVGCFINTPGSVKLPTSSQYVWSGMCKKKSSIHSTVDKFKKGMHELSNEACPTLHPFLKHVKDLILCMLTFGTVNMTDAVDIPPLLSALWGIIQHINSQG